MKVEDVLKFLKNVDEDREVDIRIHINQGNMNYKTNTYPVNNMSSGPAVDKNSRVVFSYIQNTVDGSGCSEIPSTITTERFREIKKLTKGMKLTDIRSTKNIYPQFVDESYVDIIKELVKEVEMLSEGCEK